MIAHELLEQFVPILDFRTKFFAVGICVLAEHGQRALELPGRNLLEIDIVLFQ